MKFLLVFLLITFCVLDKTTAIDRRKGATASPFKTKTGKMDPLPCNFFAWDKNGDYRIDIQEFFDMVKYDQRLLPAFKSGDKDGNGFLSPSELLKTPVNFEKC
ncbi:uncharacterized protein LOC134276413 [Saccostrea cucullata]|uniref:uncharacterized protein LOC134276413 n=1 Tax=Saccostrea cuccullata TaxID=36930 RepID=UPI002ED41AA7